MEIVAISISPCRGLLNIKDILQYQLKFSFISDGFAHDNPACAHRGNMYIYCLLQVSTETGVKSHYFNLHVMVPTAFILGSDEYHTQAGNAISLVCIIENVSFISL